MDLISRGIRRSVTPQQNAAAILLLLIHSALMVMVGIDGGVKNINSVKGCLILTPLHFHYSDSIEISEMNRSCTIHRAWDKHLINQVTTKTEANFRTSTVSKISGPYFSA